jgi:NADH-quinone oxidoreductase subunit N
MLSIAGAVVLMLAASAVGLRRGVSFALALAGIAASLTSLIAGPAQAPSRPGALFVFDPFAAFFSALFGLAAMVALVLARHDLLRKRARAEELFLLIMLASLGCFVLAAAAHLITLFLGFELLSLGLYAAIAYRRGGAAGGPPDRRSTEAALKYLVLGGAASAFLLFGIALAYADLPTLELSGLARRIDLASSPVGLAAEALILAALAFKLALAPFHMWAPDVYEGAPAPVGAFLAAASKGAVLVALLRAVGPSGSTSLSSAIAVLAVLSMLAGNLLALRQDNLKRLLGYSSIAQLGYLATAFSAEGPLAVQALSFALVAYAAASAAAFGAIAALSPAGPDRDRLEDYRGLVWRRPALGALLLVSLLSLAGIPATAGFIGKAYLVAAVASAERWGLAITLIGSSVIGLYYYLRVAFVLVLRPGPSSAPAPVEPPGRSWDLAALLGALVAALVGLGLYPAPLIDALAPVAASLRP